MSDYKYLFGPVPSRRFGRSLGVDLTPFKTCTLNCIFCQLGRTTVKTIKRAEYVPMDAALSEIKDWLKTEGNADYITLSGSGEPTLHSRFGEVLAFARENTDIPTALLTNGTMLLLPEVRDAASIANVVKISLSAWDMSSFDYINRPHPQLEFERLFDGIKAFREQFEGKLWLEVFLIWGVNSTPGDVGKIAALAREIGPDRVQLNTAVRPPAEDFATALPNEHMEELVGLFDPPAEIIAEFRTDAAGEIRANEATILSMIQRRPCTAEQIGETFGMHLNEVAKYVGKLSRAGEIKQERRNGVVYYTAERRECSRNAHV